jgi:hypothetical protein
MLTTLHRPLYYWVLNNTCRNKTISKPQENIFLISLHSTKNKFSLKGHENKFWVRNLFNRHVLKKYVFWCSYFSNTTNSISTRSNHNFQLEVSYCLLTAPLISAPLSSEWSQQRIKRIHITLKVDENFGATFKF